ncbi:hypothetical protein ACFL6U_29800, partial [Planctomycetota bacterium]
FGVSAVRLYAIPNVARELNPADGTANVDPPMAVLTWRAGREAATHELYISTDEQAVIDRTVPVVTLPEASYVPDLDLDMTYYWRVDEVNDTEDPAVWVGGVQNFSTAASTVVDDMESYTVNMWETWADGYEDPTNGALVGNGWEATPETEIVYEGSKSMPMTYGDAGIQNSWTTRAIDSPKDWSAHGIKSLSLYLHGSANNTGVSQIYLKINDKRVNYQEPANLPPSWGWKQWIIDLSTVGTDLTDVRSLTVGVEGGTGILYLDNIRLYRNALPDEQVVTWFEAESGTLGATMMLFDDAGGALGASGGQYIGTEDGSGEDTGSVQVDGIATYSFSVDQEGVYKVAIRGGDFGGNSFYFRIPGAIISTSGNAANPGWVACNTVAPADALGWSLVTDYDDGDAVVEFTLTAGDHTLDISRREDGAYLDAIAITQ